MQSPSDRPAERAVQSPSKGTLTESLTIAERDVLIGRLQTAWKDLSPDAQAAVRPLLERGHQELADYVASGKPPAHHTQMTLRLKSYLTNDWDAHLARLEQKLNLAGAQPVTSPAAPQAIQVTTAPDGSILGSGRFQQLDPRWELVAGTVWLEHLLFKHPFPPGAPDSPEPIPDNVSIALLSDWGTGNFGAGDAPSVKIANFASTLKPTYTVHLGDVYYAGQTSEETNNFLSWWPQGSSASFALNSNHDMYSGGGPYFDQVVGGPIFNKLQSPWSFFALETSHWIVIGLDSAYFSSALQLYLSGTLGHNNAQTQFLKTMAQRAGDSQKKVILLTHHNPIPVAGIAPLESPAPLQLFVDVMDAFAGQPPPAYWYYGHEHVGAAYAPLQGSGIRCRCIGHGALPWGQSTDLANAQAAGLIDWHENRLANDPDDPLRVYNGFAVLHLNGPDLTETFHDELGGVAWRP
ncbi:MAG: metallophosphoesterase family protein [Janthinobacterium lividum]